MQGVIARRAGIVDTLYSGANVAVHLAQGPTRSQEEAKILFNAKNSQNG